MASPPAEASPRDAAQAHLAAIVSSSDDAILSKDRDGVITTWNRAAERLYGYSAEEAIGQPISILVPGERAGEEREILAQILAGERVDHYDTRRVTKSGTVVDVSLSVSPVRGPDGSIVAAAVIARPIGERLRAEQRAERLQRVTAALARQVTPQAALDVLLRESSAALDADAATVGLVTDDGERIELAASVGYSEPGLSGWRSFPLAADVPMAEAVRSREPVWCVSKEELADSYPTIAAAEIRYEALAVVPMIVGDAALGAVALSFDGQRTFPPEERAFLTAAIQQAAQALARARLYETERDTRERLGLLAQASALLSSSLDLETTLGRLAFMMVPRLGDWCSVDLAEPAGGVRNVALAHVEPAKIELADEMRRRFPPEPDGETGVSNVIRTGASELYPEITDELLAETVPDPEQLALLRDLGLRSAMIVPMRARERTLGTITLVAAESGRRYDESDVALLEDLAHRAALAADNALLFRAEHEAALTLQRALLPDLPALSGRELTARYLPGAVGLEVGGDWYDVIETGADRVTLIVGDVAGSGIRAAAVMGRLRTALRAFVLEGHQPAPAVERLDRLMKDFPEPEMATLLHIDVDLHAHSVAFVRAGHPPAMLRRPDGRVIQLGGQGSRPIGLLADPGCRTLFAGYEPDSQLLLYTDGLVERRDRGIDAGLTRLAEAFAAAPAELDACVDAVIGELVDEELADDVAVLAMRI